jgi:hypothetical protein
MEHTEFYPNFVSISFFYTGAHLRKKLQMIFMVYYFHIHICIQFVVDNIQINNSVHLS